MRLTTRKIMFALVLAFAGVAVLLVSTLIRQYRHYESAYAVLIPGTQKAMVLKQFGRPKEIRPCTLKPSWDAEPLEKQFTGCTEEYWYFSRISPEQWIIGFNEDGRAVTKYHFVSP